MTRAWVVGQETVVARASVLVGNVDLNGFTGGHTVNNAAAPFDSVVFLSLAAVRSTGFAKVHRLLHQVFVNHKSSRHTFNQRADKRAVA